ncbi:MAG: DUF1844 domain-containing protein [Deltaproteobacteria bacterium]|nr:DUF1844 domain-containing protein [Deltaproteobacteria bacterium]
MSTDETTPDAAYERVTEGANAGLPPVDFATFILSLATSAFVSLGEVDGPEGESGIDLPMARQTIDQIAMLQEKTQGNLSGAEERLVNQVLFDLRMKFVDAAAANKKP